MCFRIVFFLLFFFFFFQAEDGIRDADVTGVQTCALPILVFLVDLSGSMSSQNKLPLLKSSLKVLLDELRPDDRVSIVYYANNVGVLLEPTKASEKQKIIEVIDKMNASGGTSGGGEIELAYEMAEKHFLKDGNNRIILATEDRK